MTKESRWLERMERRKERAEEKGKLALTEAEEIYLEALEDATEAVYKIADDRDRYEEAQRLVAAQTAVALNAVEDARKTAWREAHPEQAKMTFIEMLRKFIGADDNKGR